MGLWKVDSLDKGSVIEKNIFHASTLGSPENPGSPASKFNDQESPL
jgi:hypothetical protein